MRRMDQISSAVGLAVALLYLLEASKLPLWKGTTFGSGLFPTILGTGLAAVSLLSLLRASIDRTSIPLPEGLVPPRRGMVNLACVIGSLAAYALVVELLGFMLSTFALMAFLLIALEPAKKRSGLVLAGTVVAIAYVLFVMLLKLQVPRGIIG